MSFSVFLTVSLIAGLLAVLTYFFLLSDHSGDASNYVEVVDRPTKSAGEDDEQRVDIGKTSGWAKYAQWNTASTSHSDQPFSNPVIRDVLQVKADLAKVSKLPLEIIDLIIDHAEYWPCTISKTKSANSAVGRQREDVFIVSYAYSLRNVLLMV